jgi:hypothetical protein
MPRKLLATVQLKRFAPYIPSVTHLNAVALTAVLLQEIFFISKHVQTGSKAHPAFPLIRTGVLPGGKAAGT